MFTGSKIKSVKGVRNKEGPLEGLNVNIAIEGVEQRGEAVEVKFDYTADYRKQMAIIKIKGSLFFKEDLAFAEKIKQAFDETKGMPPDFLKVVLNTANYICGVEAALLTETLGLKPPLFPMKISKLEENAGS